MSGLLITSQIIFQSGRAADLGTLNTLGLAVFLVGLALILLMAAHWYRMKDTIERKQRMHSRFGKGDGSDDISQLQHMTRKELKEMVRKEKEEKEQDEQQDGEEKGRDALTAAKPVTETPSDEEKEDALAKYFETPRIPVREIPKPDVPDESAAPELPGPPESVPEAALEAELLAKIVMPGEKEKDDEKKPGDRELTEPKNPYIDKIERSPLSTDIPDEFKKKSRKI